MIISFRYKSLFFTFLLALFFFECTPDTEKKLNKGIELINNGEKEKAIPYIEDWTIITSSLKNINKGSFKYSGNLLYSKNKNTYKILWPAEADIELSGDYNLLNYSKNPEKVILSNGTEFKIFGIEGNLTKTIEPLQDNENKIEAFIVINSNIYYFRNKKIYVYNLLTGNEIIFTDEKFYKPFTSDIYNVEFKNNGNILAITIGLAGKYNLYIADLEKKSVISRNIKISSANISIKDNAVYYITGDAGKYYLTGSDINSGKTKTEIIFNELADIVFFNNGIVFEQADGIRISDFEGNIKHKITFNYKLKGKCDNNPVFEYNNIFYVMDILKFLSQLEFLNNAVPDFFNDRQM
ncbi:MAG: hypothetical protein JW864_11020 [Spirochaetes bacterium]|nr:hypothetical protein [Spirochaetota bacterium]